MKLTTVFLTGIRLFSDTFYPGGLMLHCIQSAWIKTLIVPGLHELLVVFSLKVKKKKKPEAEV